jgi:chromatin segregation and condensation protein Rec8/ScpA/Scc1 (kleisin family)
MFLKDTKRYKKSIHVSHENKILLSERLPFILQVSYSQLGVWVFFSQFNDVEKSLAVVVYFEILLLMRKMLQLKQHYLPYTRSSLLSIRE